MSLQSEVRTASPPPSSPPDSANPRKRAGEDENVSSAPKPKKRLFGRTLGSELKEISSNSVSNSTVQAGHDSSAKQQSQEAPPGRVSLPTPPAEQASDIPSSTREPARYDYALSTGGRKVHLAKKKQADRISYERLIAERSENAEAGKPQKDYYGINIHELLAQAEADAAAKSAEAAVRPNEPTPDPVIPSVEGSRSRKRAGMMWTEKYRAKKFTDLCGDERTHRQVLKWLKAWDHIVYPGMAKPKPRFRNGAPDQDEQHHRKILLLTGPPGLGKTTLAHVCAKQVGYECVEVNASDERSSSVVKNRIRDCLGTENVRGVNVKSGSAAGARRPGKPVCVILDEVDGVAGGSGASDGGFMKALVDLVLLDQKNSKKGDSANGFERQGRKGDSFRLLRPLILVCNDVYASALRPLRSSGVAEIIHVRKPPLDKVIERTRFIFDREGVACDDDAVRRLCEHTWGVSNRKESRSNRSSGDGDMRSVLVTAEWAATKLRSKASDSAPRLTKQWIDTHIIMGSFDNGNRGLGRGGAREAADRVFMENAGFGKKGRSDSSQHKQAAAKQFIIPGGPKPATDTARSEPIRMLRECIDTADEHDRVINEVFTAWPTYTFQDDTILSKPNAAYEWLDFHDRISSRIFGGGSGISSGQEWELKPYHSTPALGFHYLFGNGSRQQPQHQQQTNGKFGQQQDADGRQKGKVDDETDLSTESLPFSGPRASYDANEVYKETRAVLTSLQASEDFNIELKRMFQRPEDLAVDLLPQLTRMLAPAVKPVTVGGGRDTMPTASVRRDVERAMVARSVHAMAAVGVSFERYRVEDQRAGHAGFVYRMEPPLDSASTYESLGFTNSSTTSSATGLSSSSSTTTRYAVRQLMHQEHDKYMHQCAAEARRARGRFSDLDTNPDSDSKDGTAAAAAQAMGPVTGDSLPTAAKVKRDFFGRIIQQPKASGAAQANSSIGMRPASRGDAGVSAGSDGAKGKIKIWATFNEGFSNAVRKPISLKELMDGL